MGRARTVNRLKLGRILCDRIAKGELVSEVCEDLRIANNSPFRWAADDAGFGKLYARAREDQAHALAEKAMQISAGNDALTVAWERGIEAAVEEMENSPPGERKGWRRVVNALENALVQRNRLRVDTLKWFTSKIAPRHYGEKLDVTTDGKPLPVSGVVVLPATAAPVEPEVKPSE